jgi:hypothetical protein
MPILNAQGLPAREVEVLHPAREMGRESGAKSAEDESVFLQVIDAALDALLDETTPERIGEKVYENLLGYIEGREATLAVKPLLFLSRLETARVERLPRRIRRAWFSLYKAGVRRWQRGGGQLSGKRPVLPEIPG